MPRVSVLTASYNQDRYVDRCLDSVRDQTYKDFEHVVVDDGSTDRTPERLEMRRDELVYVRQENAGNVVSRNRALELSSGEFVAVLDGDDWWDATKLERQMAIMDACPDVGLVYTGMVEVSEDGVPVSGLLFTDVTADPIAAQIVSNATPFSSMLIRRSALESDVLVDPKYNLVGDRHLTLRVALRGWRFAAVSGPMLYLRSHPGSMRFSEAFRSEYLRQLLGVLSELEADPRLPAEYRPAIRRGESRAYFTTGWLMIDRGSAKERRDAIPYLREAARRDPRLWPRVMKQFAKSYIRSLGV